MSDKHINSSTQGEWVFVPKNPTLEMSRAVLEETRFCNPVGIYQKMLAAAPAAPHLAITYCDNCGCDWLDNGLNPVGCPYCKQSEHEHAIEALRAENNRLRELVEEFDEINDKLRHLLTRTAAALKGEPPDGVWHSWHDLPEMAAQLKEALEEVLRVNETDAGNDVQAWANAMLNAHAALEQGGSDDT